MFEVKPGIYYINSDEPYKISRLTEYGEVDCLYFPDQDTFQDILLIIGYPYEDHGFFIVTPAGGVRTEPMRRNVYDKLV